LQRRDDRTKHQKSKTGNQYSLGCDVCASAHSISGIAVFPKIQHGAATCATTFVMVALVHGAHWSPSSPARRCRDHSSPLHLANSSGLDLRVRPCKTSHLQSLLYSTFQAISLSVNYEIFSALLLTGGLWRSYPVLAAAVGSLIAAVLS